MSDDPKPYTPEEPFTPEEVDAMGRRLARFPVPFGYEPSTESRAYATIRDREAQTAEEYSRAELLAEQVERRDERIATLERVLAGSEAQRNQAIRERDAIRAEQEAWRTLDSLGMYDRASRGEVFSPSEMRQALSALRQAERERDAALAAVHRPGCSCDYRGKGVMMDVGCLALRARILEGVRKTETEQEPPK